MFTTEFTLINHAAVKMLSYLQTSCMNQKLNWSDASDQTVNQKPVEMTNYDVSCDIFLGGYAYHNSYTYQKVLCSYKVCINTFLT